jgi:malonyl CoA-acyl carrier protein transacylase
MIFRRTFSAQNITSPVRKKAILFPGQGAQVLIYLIKHVGSVESNTGMGADIYKEFQAAKDVIDECEEALGARLKSIMFEGPQVLLFDLEHFNCNSKCSAWYCIIFMIAILCHSIALLRVLQVLQVNEERT